MRRWRHPSLSIHGIHGAFAEPGEKTVIPAKGLFLLELEDFMVLSFSDWKVFNSNRSFND